MCVCGMYVSSLDMYMSVYACMYARLYVCVCMYLLTCMWGGMGSWP